MKSTKTSITVSIDLEDEFEKELFEYVMSKGKGKKSGYIKRLIYNDMMGINKQAVPVVEEEENEDIDAMLHAF